MEILTMLVSNKFKEGESDVEGVNNSNRVINDAMNNCMESRMAQDIVNEKNQVMNRDQNFLAGERIIEVRMKRVEFLLERKLWQDSMNQIMACGINFWKKNCA